MMANDNNQPQNQSYNSGYEDHTTQGAQQGGYPPQNAQQGSYTQQNAQQGIYTQQNVPQGGYPPQNVPQGYPAQVAPKVKKPLYKKWWFWLIIVIVVLFLIFLLIPSNDTSSSSSSVNSANVSTTAASSSAVKIDDYRIEILEAEQCTDWEGVKSIKVKYKFTNNSDEATSFDMSFIDNAYQDGIELETTFKDYDSTLEANASNNVQPGYSIEVVKIYELKNTTSDVDVEVEGFLTVSEAVAKMTFEF